MIFLAPTVWRLLEFVPSRGSCLQSLGSCALRIATKSRKLVKLPRRRLKNAGLSRWARSPLGKSRRNAKSTAKTSTPEDATFHRVTQTSPLKNMRALAKEASIKSRPGPLGRTGTSRIATVSLCLRKLGGASACERARTLLMVAVREAHIRWNRVERFLRRLTFWLKHFCTLRTTG